MLRGSIVTAMFVQAVLLSVPVCSSSSDVTILNNFLDDSTALAYANKQGGVLPTEASHAFTSLLMQASSVGMANPEQQNIVHQLSSVIQLLAKQGPTPALVQFVNQTNTMIETQLKGSIRQGLVNLSTQVNSSFTQGYQQCDAAYASTSGPSGTVASLTQAFTPLVPDFSSCRATESTFQNSMTQAATLAATLSATQVSKCAIFSALDSSTLTCPTRTGENASAYALRMSAFFGQQNSNWTFLRSDCASATIAASTQNSTSQAAASSWSTQKTTCDNKQDVMDAASCSVFTASVTACQNYQGCYTQFATSFQTYQQGYNSQLGGLISQWASLLQMQCLINGIVNSSSGQNCSNQVLMTQQATQSLPLYYPSPLPAPSCTTAVGYAGTDSYVRTVYNVLPANAPAKFCVASCCPTTTTTTTRVALISGSMTFNVPAVSSSQLRSSLPAALAASLGVGASQVSVSVSGSSSPYSVTYFVSAPLASQQTVQTTINGFNTPATATTLQTNLASQLAAAGATVASSAVSVSGVSTPSSSTVGSQTLPNLATAVAVSGGSLTLNLGSVTGSTSSVQAAALNALTAYFGTSQVMTNVTLVRSSPLTFNVSYNVSFPIGSLSTLQTLSNGATSSALQTRLTSALTSSGISTGALTVQNFVAPVAALIPASSIVIVATTTATTTTATTTTLTTITLTTTTTAAIIAATVYTSASELSGLPVSFSSMGTASALGISGKSFSAGGWVYWPASNVGNDDQTIVAQDVPGGDATHRCLHLVLRNKMAYFGFYGNDCASSATVPTDTWTHLLFVFDASAGTKTIYQNGQQVGSCSNQRTTFTSDQPVYIGRYAGGRGFYGSIKDVRIWTSVVTASQAQANFQVSYGEAFGCCRFDSWTATGQGYLTKDSCQARCTADSSCVCFDIARQSGNTWDCYLFYARSTSGIVRNYMDECGNGARYLKATTAIAATINTAVYTAASERSGYPISFASMGTATALGISGRSFSAGAWIYWPSSNVNNDDQTIIAQDVPGGDATSKCLHLVVRNKMAYFGFYGNDCASSATVPSNVWTHLLWVFDASAGTKTIYQNGQQVGSCSNQRTTFTSDQPVYISRYAGGRGFYGKIKDVRVWTSVVTASQALANFQAR